MGIRQKLFGLDNQTTQSSKSFEVWQEEDGSIQCYQNDNPLVSGEYNPSTGGIASLTVSGTKVVDFEFGDNLTSPGDTTTLTAAMSTTVALSATATGTYRKARVSWINNGASASAKLYISVNADNDVQGLVASQSSRRRDHEMTMGDAIILVCDVPITRLTFSSDVSITSNTHRLIVTFGE